MPPMVHIMSHRLRMLSKLVLAHNFEGVGRVPHTSFFKHPAYDHRHDPCRVGCRAMPPKVHHGPHTAMHPMFHGWRVPASPLCVPSLGRHRWMTHPSLHQEADAQANWLL